MTTGTEEQPVCNDGSAPDANGLCADGSQPQSTASPQISFGPPLLKNSQSVTTVQLLMLTAFVQMVLSQPANNADATAVTAAPEQPVCADGSAPDANGLCADGSQPQMQPTNNNVPQALKNNQSVTTVQLLMLTAFVQMVLNHRCSLDNWWRSSLVV